MKEESLKCYFTLIEMLVVIAIIGILASMLMPSLQKAIDSSKNINCVSNLKQIGQVFITYSDDNNGFLPSARFFGGTANAAYWRSHIGSMGYLSEYTSLVPSKNLPDIAFCPLTEINRNVCSTYAIPRSNGDYGLNIVDSYFFSRKLMKLNNIKNVLSCDSRRGEDQEYWTNGSCYIEQGSGTLTVTSSVKAVSLRHNEKFNASFPDGSVSGKGVRWIENSTLYNYVIE